VEVEGAIRNRVGSGICVTGSLRAEIHPAETDEGPFELLRAREFIEVAIAAETALNVRPADLKLLDDTLRLMDDVSHPIRSTFALDRGSHTTVAGILGNAILVRFIGELFGQHINPYFGLLSRSFENDDSWQAAGKEHRAVRDAIVARDPERARDATRTHLRQSQLKFSRHSGESPAAMEVVG
jgi:DNA-binding GntR family transcriptional regulator